MPWLAATNVLAAALLPLLLMLLDCCCQTQATDVSGKCWDLPNNLLMVAALAYVDVSTTIAVQELEV